VGGHSIDTRQRAVIAAQRAVTSTLKVLGQRERVLDWRLARARAARARIARDDPRARPALFELDRQLNEIIDLDDGFFVEAGANDGYTQSNTWWLERFRGWRGVLVEPMPELSRQCCLERPAAVVVQAALVPFDFEDEFVRMRFADLMSTVSGDHVDDERTRFGTAVGWRDPYELDVPARTLTDVLDQAGAPDVDLLSLDVEGFEPQVLAGIDFDRRAPRWILVEVHDEPTGRPAVERVLGDRYVFHGRLSPMDFLYRRV
jgi:FkbM family methyltransferase